MQNLSGGYYGSYEGFKGWGLRGIEEEVLIVYRRGGKGIFRV